MVPAMSITEPSESGTVLGGPAPETPAAGIAGHPYRAALFFLLVVVTVLVVVGGATRLFPVGTLVQLAAGDAILAAIGIALVIRLGWLEQAGFTTGIRRRYLPLLALPCIVALLPLGDGVRVTAPSTLLVFAGVTLTVGLAEETFFRGLILPALLPAGTLRAAVISALFFAAPHLLNLVGGLWDPAFTAADMVAAFGVGITFAAIRLRTGSIFPCIGIHALVDFCSIVALGGIEVPVQSPSSLLASAFVGVILAGYGICLLRHLLKDRFGVPAAPA